MAVDVLVDLHSIRAALAAEEIEFKGIFRNTTGEMKFRDTVANGGAVVTLNELFTGAGGGHLTFVAHTDTPANYISSALKFLRVNAAGTAVEFVTVAPATTWLALLDTPGVFVDDRIPHSNPGATALIFDAEVRGDQVKSAEPTVSGVLGQTDGQLTFTDATQVFINAGFGKLLERVTTTHFKAHGVSWSAQNITIPGGVLSDPFGVVVIEDPTFTGTGTPVVVSIATATVSYLRSRIRLGYTVHQAGAHVAVVQAPETTKDSIQGVEELWRVAGVNKLAGTGIHKEIVATLTSQVTASIFIGHNINFRTDPTNPHERVFAAVNPLVFDTTANDGAVFASAISAFPTTWNNAGVETALTGQRAVVHQVYHLPGAGDFCQLGTTNYLNFDTAVQSLIPETVNNPLPEIALVFGVRHSYVVLRAGVTQWADGDAKIFPILGDGVGGGGAGAGALNVASMEVEHSTVLTAVSTSPVLVVYDVVNDGDINGFFSYAAGVLTCDKPCRAVFLPRLDSTVNPGSTRSGIRLDIRHNDVTVQVFDNNSRTDASDAPDTQNNASANLVLAATDTIKIYINSYVTGLSDVWAGPNRMQVLVMKDLT